jgi:hypothetical protein
MNLLSMGQSWMYQSNHCSRSVYESIYDIANCGSGYCLWTYFDHGLVIQTYDTGLFVGPAYNLPSRLYYSSVSKIFLI